MQRVAPPFCVSRITQDINGVVCLVYCIWSFYFLLTENADQQQKKEFLAELELMKSMAPHPNIVGLVGCCTKSGEWDHLLCAGLEARSGGEKVHGIEERFGFRCSRNGKQKPDTKAPCRKIVLNIQTTILMFWTNRKGIN